MALSLPVKALAFLLFVGGIAAATYGVQRTVPAPDLEGQLFATTFLHPVLNATDGHVVTFAVEVVNRGQAGRVVRFELDGDGVDGTSAARNVAHGERTIFFVPVQVDADEPGDRLLRMRLLTRDGTLLREREDVATVRVLASGAPGLAAGDSADALFVGRIADTGSVFQTNDLVFKNGTFPQTSEYQFYPRTFTITTAPSNVVRGFYRNILGMQAGESRTFTITPEEGYGNATDEQREPRTELISRAFPLPIVEETRTRAAFARFIAETRQGNASEFQAGQRFILPEPQTGNEWPYRVVSINETHVVYAIDVSVGEAYTLYPFWPGSSVVESVNETLVLFNTTPSTPIGQGFQARTYWPNMTVVAEVGEAFIKIRHDPPLGFRYTLPVRGQPLEFTIKELTDEEIVTTTPNPHPLSGKLLEFDVTLLNLNKKAAAASG